MILPAAAALLIIVVVAGLALDLTLFRSASFGVVLVIAGGGLLVLAGGAVVLVGVGAGGGDEDVPTEPRSRAAETPSTVAVTTTTTAGAARPGTARAGTLNVREVAVRAARDDEFVPTPSVVDRLPDRAVLLVTATGFPANAAGLIEQCSAAGCANAFPVAFGEDGAARLQYLVEDGFSPSSGVRSHCRSGDSPCVVRVRSGVTAAYLTTVFGGAARPAPTVTVDAPDGQIVDGRAALVVVTGFVPGERVQAMLCAAPASSGTSRCGAPGTVAPFTIDADGTGRTAIVIRRGRVGTQGVACGRETACGVAVARAGSSIPGAVAVVTFAAGPSATYDSARVLLGLLIAGLLLLVAFVLVRSTDWRKPTEADTPELDRAVLAE